MGRITYLELPVIFIAAMILSALLLVAWIILLIPAMFSSKIRGMGTIKEQIMSAIAKNMVKGMMPKRPAGKQTPLA